MEPSRGFHRFAVVTAGATFALLFLGGLVTSTGSALAVPDWPLSFGQVFPPMVGGVLFEHGHRLAASSVGLLTVVLAIWSFRGSEPALVRRLAVAALCAVVLQGLLGGMTVLYKLPTAVSVAHACLGQTFFCIVVTLALVTGTGWRRAGVEPSSPLPVLATLTTALVFCQLVLGALVRHLHAGLAIPDFPLAFGRVVPPLETTLIAVQFAHRVGALVVTSAVAAAVAIALRRHGSQSLLRRPAFLLVALVALQITLGGTIIWSHRAVLPTTAHQTTGAAVLATSLVLTLRAWRLTRGAEAVRARLTPQTAAA